MTNMAKVDREASRIMAIIDEMTTPAKMSRSETRELYAQLRSEFSMREEGLDADEALAAGG